ncbi:Trypsin-like peptidase domain-containing protein [Halolactibacillus miurensis]|uniref:Trypsin-like peptidase domain-containing protein n=2 Tax=Halolactibacillus miurensis TaxID=306541 RepID=A0A1I6V695_9BACI|nr:Trypsin-like peptidase domain-containing protein [Halolactibacillus miurensis]
MMTTDDKNQKQNQISKQETPEEMMRKQQWRAERQKQRDMEQEKKRQEEQAYLRQVKQEMIDADLFEPLTHEEMIDIIREERQQGRKKKTPLTLSKDMKLIGLLLALVVLIQGLALVFQTFNIPAIEFVKTSIALSFDEEVEQIKDTVVIIDTGDGRGTGFLISPDGLIVTNAHVVDDETEVTVGIKDKDVTTGEVIKHIPEVDLAFVQVEGRDLPYLELSRQSVEAGESITFVGNPLRFNRIANSGTIIGETPATLEAAVYALDAPVYKGNSGSPVVNAAGEVVAVIYATRESVEYGRVGLAIDVRTVQTWVDELAFGKQN